MGIQVAVQEVSSDGLVANGLTTSLSIDGLSIPVWAWTCRPRRWLKNKVPLESPGTLLPRCCKRRCTVGPKCAGRQLVRCLPGGGGGALPGGGGGRPGGGGGPGGRWRWSSWWRWTSWRRSRWSSRWRWSSWRRRWSSWRRWGGVLAVVVVLVAVVVLRRRWSSGWRWWSPRTLIWCGTLRRQPFVVAKIDVAERAS